MKKSTEKGNESCYIKKYLLQHNYKPTFSPSN